MRVKFTKVGREKVRRKNRGLYKVNVDGKFCGSVGWGQMPSGRWCWVWSGSVNGYPVGGKSLQKMRENISDTLKRYGRRVMVCAV